MMATNKEIVTALHEYYETRDKLKDCRANLVRIAVECGADQQDAIKANVAEYLPTPNAVHGHCHQ